MRTIKASSTLPGDPFLPNRFIFGDAVDAEGLEEHEYLVHTEEPTFVCRIVVQDLEFKGSDAEDFRSAMLYDEAENVSYYACNDGVTLTDFNFYGTVEPTAGVLQKICDDAIACYWAIDEAYKKREAEPIRRLRVMKRETDESASVAERAASLAAAARGADSDPAAGIQLAVQTQAALNSNDPRIFTEAQLALVDEPQARNTLLSRARELIAFPDVARPDGSFKPYELWAVPLMYTVEHAGEGWYFPGLDGLEAVLREHYHLAPKVQLHVSPALFTHGMLRDTACQTLIHVADALDAGEVFVPEEVDVMRRRYEEERQNYLPRLTLNWIVFAVERGTLQGEHADPQLLLDAMMPVIEQSMNAEIDYGEATIFQPEPLWQSFATGTQEYNVKRLMFCLSYLEKSIGLNAVRAEVEYRPQASAWWLSLLHTRDGESLTSFAWLISPDLAPDRDAALVQLSELLQQFEISMVPPRDLLH